MLERHEWLRFGAVGVAALLEIPGDLVVLGLDGLLSHLDATPNRRGRQLSNHVAEALADLAHHHDPGTIESARLTSQNLLARFRLSDADFVALNLEAERAAEAVLSEARFSSDERIEVEPLCRKLLIRFYRTIVESPDLSAELLPRIHREQLRRLGRIEIRQEEQQKTLESILAEVTGAAAGGDQELVRKLIDVQANTARDLIDGHRPHAAMQLLQGLLDAATDSLEPDLRYRILSNLGNAHLQLFDAQSAGLIFLEAAKHAPDDDDDRAVAQHARAHLLLGELDAAERIADAGAERFKSSGRLLAMQFAIANQRGEIEDPEAAVPDAFSTDRHVSYTVARIYAQRGVLDKAAKWIKIAYQSDQPDWRTRKAYGEILVRRAVEHNIALRGGPSGLIRDFVAGAAELEKIWEIVHAGEPIEATAEIAAQVAVSRKLANDRDGARRACDAGFAMEAPPTLLLRVAANLAEEDRRFDDAVNLLRQIDMARMPERDLFIASAQAELGRNDNAVQTLAALAENGEAAGWVRATARARSIELRARRRADPAIRDEALALAEAEPDVVAYRIVAGALHEELEEHESAVIQAKAARELLDKDSSLNDQIGVADLLLDLGEASDAAEIYAQVALYPVDSVIGRKLLRALLEADSRAALRGRLDAMPAGERTDQFYLWIEAALLERVGELEEAMNLLDTYLHRAQGAAGLRLTWIAFLERLGRTEELHDFLGRNKCLSERYRSSAVALRARSQSPRVHVGGTSPRL